MCSKPEVHILLTRCSLRPITESILGHSQVLARSCPRPQCGDEQRIGTPANQDFLLRVSWQTPAPLEIILRNETFSNEGLNGLRCGKCGATSNFTGRYQIQTAPAVLGIHLLRFCLNQAGTAYVKNTDNILFPEELDLTPFTETNTRLRYGLQSAVYHRGTRFDGHYAATAKGPSGVWLALNDQVRFPGTIPLQTVQLTCYRW